MSTLKEYMNTHTNNYIYEEKNGYKVVSLPQVSLFHSEIRLLGFGVLFIASTGLLEVTLNNAFCFLAKQHPRGQLHNKTVVAEFGL